MGNESFFIDKISGKLATEYTPKETLEEKIITNVHSILYWVDRRDITGPPPISPEKNPQFVNWEIPIQNWWLQNSHKYQQVSWADKPTMLDNIHTNTSAPKILIIEPKPGSIYDADEKIQLKISSLGSFPLKKIDIFVNDVFLGTREAPFSFYFTPEDLENIGADNVLKIISYDSMFNRAETTSSFKVAY